MALPEVQEVQSRPKTKVEADDLIDLWKYFQDRADMLKDKQWTIGTWILSLMSGLIAFTLSQEIFSITETGFKVTNPGIVRGLSLIGILLCIYAGGIFYDYGKHIQRNWDRAGRVKAGIDGLNYYWEGPDKNQLSKRFFLPKETAYLFVFVLGYFLAFLVMIIVSK